MTLGRLPRSVELRARGEVRLRDDPARPHHWSTRRRRRQQTSLGPAPQVGGSLVRSLSIYVTYFLRFCICISLALSLSLPKFGDYFRVLDFETEISSALSPNSF